MPDPAEELKRKLEELNQAYLNGLPKRLEDIEGAWQAAIAADDDPTAHLTLLHRSTHSLVGSAGTFGYDDLSQTARSAERFFKELVETGHIPDAKGQARGRHLIGILRKKIEALITDLDPSSQPVQEDAATAGDTPVNSAPQLLLVKEDLMRSERLRQQLQQFGYQVHVLHDPADISRAIAEHAPEALVVDTRFPSASGTGTYHVQLLRETASLEAPVIFISSEDDFQTRLASVRAGGAMYFPKPVDIRALVERLDALTGKGHATPYRILLIEDDTEVCARNIGLLQRAGMEVEALAQMDELMPVLTRFRPELILLDMYMPEASGLELARIIRQDTRFLTTPILFLSTETDKEKQLAAIALGADGFLTKPVDDDCLVAAVKARLHRARLLSSAVARDSLTGLLNHLRIKEMLDAELARAQRRDSELTLVMLDIDFFKSINDRYGHMVGDQVIMQLARLLQERLRSSDIVGRYGGEEFALVLPDTTPQDAFKVVDELRTRFAREIHHVAEERFNVTFSAGIASSLVHPEMHELIEAADRALYEAKTQGRDRVVACGD